MHPLDAKAAWDAEQRTAYYEADSDPRVSAVLDVLAPRYESAGRSPAFEFGHETTPAAAEVIELAREILANLDGLAEGRGRERRADRGC